MYIVYLCVRVYTCMYAHVCRGQWLALGIFINYSSPHFLRQGFSLNPMLINLDRLGWPMRANCFFPVSTPCQ